MQQRHPELDLQRAVRASQNPRWIGVAGFVEFAAIVFVLRLLGNSLFTQVMAGFVAICATYPLLARRYVVAGGPAGVHRWHVSRFGLMGLAYDTELSVDEIDLIEGDMVTDRWTMGGIEVAIAKRHRATVIELVGLTSSE
jgi:hypothetical protein